MKKAYTKPMIAIETFQLNAGVAACKDNIHKTQYECEYEADGLVYFGGYNGACNWDPEDSGIGGDDICYHGYNSPYIFIAS